MYESSLFRSIFSNSHRGENQKELQFEKNYFQKFGNKDYVPLIEKTLHVTQEQQQQIGAIAITIRNQLKNSSSSLQSITFENLLTQVSPTLLCFVIQLLYNDYTLTQYNMYKSTGFTKAQEHLQKVDANILLLCCQIQASISQFNMNSFKQFNTLMLDLHKTSDQVITGLNKIGLTSDISYTFQKIAKSMHETWKENFRKWVKPLANKRALMAFCDNCHFKIKRPLIGEAAKKMKMQSIN